MELPKGVNISQSELDRIQAALEALAKDPHAPRSLSVSVTLHVHNEYPKMLYKGQGKHRKSVTVADADAEKEARAAAFGEYEPDAPKPEEAEVPEVTLQEAE